MTSCPTVMGWGFWVTFEKKTVSWDLNLDESSWDCGVRARLLGQWVEIRRWTKRVDFWTWARPVQLWTTWCPRVVGSDGTVSIVKIVSLSPRVVNLKVKKVIKVSYLNYRESLVFRVFFGFLCMWTFYRYVYWYILHNHIWLCYILSTFPFFLWRSYAFEGGYSHL